MALVLELFLALASLTCSLSGLLSNLTRNSFVLFSECYTCTMLPDCGSSDCLWATEEGAKHQAAQGSSHTIRQERSCRKTCTYYSLQGSEPSFSVFWERASCYWKNEVDEQVAITARTQKGAGEEICLLGLALSIFIFQSSEDTEKIRRLNLSEMKNIFFLQMSLLPCFGVNSNVPPLHHLPEKTKAHVCLQVWVMLIHLWWVRNQVSVKRVVFPINYFG